MENTVHVYNPLHCSKGIGRRTGKVIEKKRNIKNGVDNFEDYLTSDDDMTLNETDASALKNSKILADESMHLNVKQDVLKLQELSKENVDQETKASGFTGQVPGETTLAATMLTRNSNVGKRTGKIIQKKRNINSGVDNFEDYLSSDGEKSLDATDVSSVQSWDKQDTDSLGLSKKLKDAPQSSKKHANSEFGAHTLPQKSNSSAKALENKGVASLQTRNSRFGRRTGKDLLAGKELADLENFSNYLSDSHESSSLISSPPETSRRFSKSEGSRPRQTPHIIPQSNTMDLDMEDGKAPAQNINKDVSPKNNFVNQKDVERGHLGKHSDHPSDTPEANSCDLHQIPINKMSPMKVQKSNAKDVSFSELKNQSMNKSLSRKKSVKKTSLAVQAIKKSAEQKILSQTNTHPESKENHSHPKIDAAAKISRLETDVKSRQFETSLSVVDQETTKQEDLNTSNNEGLGLAENSYHEQVDDSICFKKCPESNDKRKSLMHSEKETELDNGDHCTPETSRISIRATKDSNHKAPCNTDRGTNYEQTNNYSSQQFAKSNDEIITNISTSRNKSTKENNSKLKDTDQIITNDIAKLPEELANGRNANSAKSKHGASQQGLKKGLNLMSTEVNQNYQPDKERIEIKTVSKSYSQPKNTKKSDDGDGVQTLGNEKIEDDSSHIGRMKYAFNETESDSELEEAVNDISAKSLKSKSKVEKKVGKGRQENRTSTKQIQPAKGSRSMKIDCTELITKADNEDQHLRQSHRQGSKVIKSNAISSEDSSSDPPFISVSSKAISHSSMHSSSASSSGSKKSTRRMLDLSQGEDSDKTSSETEKHVKLSRNEAEHNELGLSKLKRERPVQSKTIENHSSKYTTSSSNDENEEPMVFISIASKKIVPTLLQQESIKVENQISISQKSNKKLRNQKEDADNLKDQEKITKTICAPQNIKDGSKKEKWKKRKVSKDIKTQDPDMLEKARMSSEDDSKKRKKDLTPQAEPTISESAYKKTIIATKPIPSRELKDTPKTGDRQRFRNYRAKIFSDCIPEVIEFSQSQAVQDDRDGYEADYQEELATFKTAKAELGGKQTEAALSKVSKSVTAKKRGRPCKSATASETNTHSKEASSENDVDDSKKSITVKKRGRPRKSASASEIETNTHSEEVSSEHDVYDNEKMSLSKVSKSATAKKRGRPRKSASASEIEANTHSEEASSEHGVYDKESSDTDSSQVKKLKSLPSKKGGTSTPISLKLIDALPNVTPRSGVSFRGRQSQSVVQDNENASPEFSLQRYKKPDPESTPCGRTVIQSNGLTSCLRNSSVPRPGKKGRRVRISNFVITGTPEKTERLTKVPNITPTTVLSPSSSPVHYAETTKSGGINTCQQSLLLPDLSHHIVRPEYKEPTGLRRSNRTRVKPIAAYKGERVIYRRDSTGYGLIVDAIQPSVGEAKLKAIEETRRKKRIKQKLKTMNVPAKLNKRLSSHIQNLSLEMTQSEILPAVNPETQEEVDIELVSRLSNVIWKGPELEPVQETDHLAGCVQLEHPSFSSGEIQLRALGQKEYERVTETLIYRVINGKAALTVNEKSTTVETGDDFLIPRGSAYGLKNLRRDVARFHYVCLHDNPLQTL